MRSYVKPFAAMLVAVLAASCTSSGSTPTATAAPTAAPATATAAPTAAPATATAQTLTKVRLSIVPTFEFQPAVVAHELGLDKEQGLDFQFTKFTTNQSETTAALARGDTEVGTGCHACWLPFFKSVPSLRDWWVTNQFAGFLVVGRKGKVKTYDELSKTMDAKAAKEEVLRSWNGKSFIMVQVDFEALLKGALGQVGMTLGDVKIINFADDSKAALAFAQGTGDFYMGNLPQQVKLLYGSPDTYVSVGGTQILGPAALWYSTNGSTAEWLAANEATAFKLLAVWYRTMRYVREKPDLVYPIWMKSVNEMSASSFTEEQVRFITTNLETYPTLEQAKETVFNPRSDLYWRITAQYYAEANKATLPEDFTLDKYMPQEDYFNRFLQQTDLVDWVNSPIP